ncbi:replicative DNA helicase [Ktedonospora formicarum]|uniref:Replicative DNA helicase n=1 Tax=Ktedonospora formicarum TaxID=2778364 RepID=A0A8J3IAP9_9CHLR|nr:replicative DNA helicase [Ktedonospora formicarum]GHO49162.1 replicative DNA helicase [Ktedonospora formicarum]
MEARFLPQNIDAETSVLGSILIDPDAMEHIVGILRAEDFYRDVHQTIYIAMEQLFAQQTPADFVTLCDALEQQNQLDEIGGESYILSLVNHVPTSGNLLHYAHIVARTSVLRRLIHAGSQIVAEAYEDQEEDVTTTLERAEQQIFEVSQRYTQGTQSASHVRELLVGYLDRLTQASYQQGMTGVPTGFKDLDCLTNGLHSSDLIIVAARPAVGKTSFALSLAYHASVHHRRNVGIFSLEMSKEQLMQRLLAIDAGIDQQHLRAGLIEDDEWERIATSMSTLSEAGIWIDDTANLSPLQLRSKARRWIADHHIDLIIIDYLQLMEAGGSDGRKGENRTQLVSLISRSLKTLARELNVPILALAQLSRAVEARASKVPQLSDLRESGSIEADADMVLLLYRDELYNPETTRPNTADVLIAKHRHGPVGEVVLTFDKRQTRFRDFSHVYEPGKNTSNII